MMVARNLVAAIACSALASAAVAADPQPNREWGSSGPINQSEALAGVVALGALAAAASAAENAEDGEDVGDERRRGHGYDDQRWVRRAAVDACVSEAEQQGERFGPQARLHHIEYVERYKSGYRVAGVIKVRKPRYDDWDDRRSAGSDGAERGSDGERGLFGHSAKIKFRCVAKRHRVTAFRFL